MSTVNEIVGGSGQQTLPSAEVYERVFEIIYDDAVFDSAIPLRDPRLPSYQSLYAPWSTAVLASKQARQANNRAAPHIWQVTCQYTNQLATNQQNQQQDPELDLPRISWTTNQQQVYRERDLRGFRKCNSAGDPPIPIPPTYESVRVATVKYFVRQKPFGLLSLVNKINSNAFTVDGEFVPVHCCRIADIQCGEPRIERGVVGRDITIQFQIGPQKALGKARDIQYIGFPTTDNTLVKNNVVVGYWIGEMLDQGRREIKAVSPYNILQVIVGEDGSEPVNPSLLNGEGTAIETPVAKNEEVYRFWYDYQEADFSLIRLE